MLDKKDLLASLSELDQHGLIGFDGFIDELYSLVKQRSSETVYEELRQMAEFGSMVQAAVGKSANMELIQKTVKAGGNGPIMANSLMTLGASVSYGGALGKPEIHPVFKDFSQACREVHSVCDPAKTMALEFNDGKLMLCQLNDLYEINAENFKAFLTKQVTTADFFCFLNWTELPNLNGVYQLVASLLDAAKPTDKRPCFIDLADFKRRTNEDLLRAVVLMKRMSSHLDIHLGLNWSEAQQMAEFLNLENLKSASLNDLAKDLQLELQLAAVCVHSHREVAAYDQAAYSVKTLYIEQPKVSTGAGDHFNAGYFRAVLQGLNLKQCLELGVLNSAHYVRRGETPSLDCLRAEL